MVHQGKVGYVSIPPEENDLKTTGVIQVTSNGGTWSPSLNPYCYLKEGLLMIDPCQSGEPIKEKHNGYVDLEFFPLEIRDIGTTFGSNQKIIQAATQAPAADKKYTEAEVAWIDPDDGFADTPVMPQLEASVAGAPASLNIEWSFKCSYDRGNGKRTARNQDEDTVYVPSGGYVTKPGNEAWRMYDNPRWQAELNQHEFFGGDAIVSMRINGTETKFYFRIGGKNPPPSVARNFIESLPNAGPNGNLWFAYAIAKSESKDCNGEGTRYNQFLVQLPKWEQSLGRPLWGDDGGTTPGGYRLIEITGDASSELTNIPREQIWNWQENARAGVSLLTSKRTTGVTWMARQKNVSNANGTTLPSLTVLNVTFAEGSKRTMTDAVTMKLNNGASTPPDDTVDKEGPATGFIIDPFGSDHFCYWKNSQNGWALNRLNHPNDYPKIKPFNYVRRVCEEVEQ